MTKQNEMTEQSHEEPIAAPEPLPDDPSMALQGLAIGE
jgi:hypothetical protein